MSPSTHSGRRPQREPARSHAEPESAKNVELTLVSSLAGAPHELNHLGLPSDDGPSGGSGATDDSASTDAPPSDSVQGDTGRLEGEVHRIAAAGTRDGGGPLPHLDMIQAAFGRHDIRSVQAHTGPSATEAATAIGATAYATGNHIAFAGAPDLHTAAHEAAHVVQQRAGVSLTGGVGQVGDVYEQHANEVADAVVAGRSAEAILDRSPTGGGVAEPVQMMASVNDYLRMRMAMTESEWDEFKKQLIGEETSSNEAPSQGLVKNTGAEAVAASVASQDTAVESSAGGEALKQNTAVESSAGGEALKQQLENVDQKYKETLEVLGGDFESSTPQSRDANLLRVGLRIAALYQQRGEKVKKYRELMAEIVEYNSNISDPSKNKNEVKDAQKNREIKLIEYQKVSDDIDKIDEQIEEREDAVAIAKGEQTQKEKKSTDTGDSGGLGSILKLQPLLSKTSSVPKDSPYPYKDALNELTTFLEAAKDLIEIPISPDPATWKTHLDATKKRVDKMTNKEVEITTETYDNSFFWALGDQSNSPDVPKDAGEVREAALKIFSHLYSSLTQPQGNSSE